MFLLAHPHEVLIFIVIDDSTRVGLMPSHRTITTTGACEALARLRSSAAVGTQSLEAGCLPVGA